MGKQNFSSLYKSMKDELYNGGPVSCKISFFSDKYEDGYDYSCIMVYKINNVFEWNNIKGAAKGFKGRGIYLIFLRTDKYPDMVKREVGSGMVHHYPLKYVFDIDYDQDIICCSGFSHYKNELKFNSVWLNQRKQAGCDTDGNKKLSRGEIILAIYCFHRYSSLGPNSQFYINDTAEYHILSS